MSVFEQHIHYDVRCLPLEEKKILILGAQNPDIFSVGDVSNPFLLTCSYYTD